MNTSNKEKSRSLQDDLDRLHEAWYELKVKFCEEVLKLIEKILP